MFWGEMQKGVVYFVFVDGCDGGDVVTCAKLASAWDVCVCVCVRERVSLVEEWVSK